MIKSENIRENDGQICLMFSPETMAKACQEYDRYSNNSAGWNAYRNRLCLETFVSWLREFEVYSQLQQPKAWPDETELPSFWEVLEGAAIEWGETRLVLMPIEAEELETFSVPRDWVDIWPADYYVAIQVSLDESEEDNWMQVWGYTTHRELKRKGQYYKRDRAYCLDKEELIPDITMMLFARQLVRNRKAGVEPVPALDRGQAVGLLERLNKPDVYYPRLAVPFEEWGGLMVNAEWRQQLYEQRLAQVQDKVPAAPVATSKSPVQLRKWFNDIVEAGWQTIEEIIEALGTGTQELNLAYGFAGSAERFRDLTTDDRFRDVAAATMSGNTFQEAVPMLINLLESSKDKLTRLQATDLLGRIAEGSQEAIAALTKLANTDRDSDMRRQAAVTLKKIDPKNVQAGVRGGKIIDLGMQLGELQVALVLTLMPELNQKTNVHLRVYPLGEKTLPSNLQLLVLSDKSDTLLSTESGSADNAVQLELRGEMGDDFTVKVALGNASMTEYFVL